MTDFQKFLLAVVVTAWIFFTGIFAWKYGHKQGYSRGFSDAESQARIDTVVRVDTVVYDRPVPVTVWKDKLVYVPVSDSILIEKHDTTYIALQSEKKIYEDTDYRAVVSGIYPKLEEISVFPKTITITDTRTIRKRWGFNVTAGPGVVWNGQFHPGVGVVAGFGYSF